jgi:hypothetical protein
MPLIAIMVEGHSRRRSLRILGADFGTAVSAVYSHRGTQKRKEEQYISFAKDYLTVKFDSSSPSQLVLRYLAPYCFGHSLSVTRNRGTRHSTSDGRRAHHAMR